MTALKTLDPPFELMIEYGSASNIGDYNWPRSNKYCIAFDKKKSKMITQIDAITTASVVERPTPTVPPVVVKPLWHATLPMIRPKNSGLMRPLTRSEVEIPPLTEFINTL